MLSLQPRLTSLNRKLRRLEFLFQFQQDLRNHEIQLIEMDENLMSLTALKEGDEATGTQELEDLVSFVV